MARWNQGEALYYKLIDTITSLATFDCNDVEQPAAEVVKKARDIIPDVVSSLQVADLVHMHEYLMYRTSMTTDARMPSYVYHGGDRVTAVIRYMLKNIELELARQFA